MSQEAFHSLNKAIYLTSLFDNVSYTLKGFNTQVPTLTGLFYNTVHTGIKYCSPFAFRGAIFIDFYHADMV